ncbi:DUF1565 domain-containing protein [Candidatus Sumerlaeota bacterium]|nr:DUF1565 domain-containing protein [Candidatus Sumerlaeota bacterium]
MRKRPINGKIRASACAILLTFVAIHARAQVSISANGELGPVPVTDIYIDQVLGANLESTAGTETDPFKSITFAMEIMNGRQAPDPWFVHIRAGVYDADPAKGGNEREIFPIALRPGITLLGEDGAESSIISGEFSPNSNSAIFFGTGLADIAIVDLTLRSMRRTGGSRSGAAAELINCSGVISGCVIENNTVSGRLPGGRNLVVAFFGIAVLFLLQHVQRELHCSRWGRTFCLGTFQRQDRTQYLQREFCFLWRRLLCPRLLERERLGQCFRQQLGWRPRRRIPRRRSHFRQRYGEHFQQEYERFRRSNLS